MSRVKMSLKEVREKINSLTREELTDLMYLAFQGGCLHTRQLTDEQEAKNKHVPMRSSWYTLDKSLKEKTLK